MEHTLKNENIDYSEDPLRTNIFKVEYKFKDNIDYDNFDLKKITKSDRLFNAEYLKYVGYQKRHMKSVYLIYKTKLTLKQMKNKFKKRNIVKFGN